MEIVERISGNAQRIVISKVTKKDVKLLTKAKYWFGWRTLVKKIPLFKLTIEGQDEILGVMALVDHPEESRIEIKLIASSKENVGTNKEFEGIVACLLAYACGEALQHYGDLACVSLVPKTVLKQHYIMKYGMQDSGRQLFLEGKGLFDWAKKNL